MFPMSDEEVWREELEGFVPPRIFDAHVHLWPPEAVPPGLEVRPTDIGMSAFPSYTLGDFRAAMQRLLPGRSVSALAFGMVHREMPREAVNDYTRRVQQTDSAIWGLATVSPSDPMEDVERWIEHYGLLGYKPYWSFVTHKAQNDVEIVDMLTPEQLQYADRRGLMVMLHIPRKYRLAEPLNKQQVRELATRYPRITWVLAHVGRAYFRAALAGHIEELCGLDNVYFDLAFVGHGPVIAYAIEKAGVGKILFGSDMPVADIRGKNVEFNNQRLYVTQQPTAWSMSNPELGLTFTRFYYEELRAIKYAVRRLRLGDSQVEDIFFRNAERLIAERRRAGG